MGCIIKYFYFKHSKKTARPILWMILKTHSASGTSWMLCRCGRSDNRLMTKLLFKAVVTCICITTGNRSILMVWCGWSSRCRRWWQIGVTMVHANWISQQGSLLLHTQHVCGIYRQRICNHSATQIIPVHTTETNFPKLIHISTLYYHIFFHLANLCQLQNFFIKNKILHSMGPSHPQ